MQNNVLIDELNESQREAVLCCDVPSLVIAGAGSGKTRVLTYKIAHLLQMGMMPWNILALTFTNKAAKEMRQRIGKMVGEEMASKLWMGTFHSIFSRILRTEAVHIGFGQDFTIYDASDRKSLIKTIIKEMQLDDKTYKPGSVASRISMAKNRLILPAAYMSDRQNFEADMHSRMPAIGQIYMLYWQRCRQANVMDFDDLLLYTWILLSEHPEVAQKWEDRFHFVLVDEYQDTNYAQHLIVWLLTQHRQRVCVVGDDAQSIYSFRGANIDNILRFQEQYKGSKLFKLEQNYRSTQTIVSAANSLIGHNRGQIRKEVFSNKEVGEPISLLQTYSDTDEANAVMRCIREFQRNEQIPYSQMAVLYRTNAQSRAFEEVMRKASIPYRVYGGTSFYQRKEIKDVIAYLRLVVNQYDEEALRRIINYPTRGIGQTTLDKVYLAASKHDMAPWQILSSPHLIENINAGTKSKLNSFVQMISAFAARQSSEDAYTIALDIVRTSGVQAEVNRGTDPEDIARQENLQELLDGIAAFVQERREQDQETMLTHYLQEVSLLSDVDENESSSDDRLTLMTVHSAKGLEFRVVFVVGMEEDLFPSQMSTDSARGLEEERRLFYVAITRAEEYLVVSHAKTRFRYGKMEFCEPSRFIREIDSRYLRVKGAGSAPAFGANTIGKPSASLASGQMPTGAEARRFVKLTPSLTSSSSVVSSSSSATPSSSASAPCGNVTVGCRVQHDRFGQGTVTAIEGKGIDIKATVVFDNVGQKQLLLRFAKIKLL